MHIDDDMHFLAVSSARRRYGLPLLLQKNEPKRNVPCPQLHSVHLIGLHTRSPPQNTCCQCLFIFNCRKYCCETNANFPLVSSSDVFLDVYLSRSTKTTCQLAKAMARQGYVLHTHTRAFAKIKLYQRIFIIIMLHTLYMLYGYFIKRQLKLMKSIDKKESFVLL